MNAEDLNNDKVIYCCFILKNYPFLYLL